MVSLHNVLKNSYKSKPAGNMNGYELDKSLSNHNQQVYYNPNEKKLLMSVAGTHNLRDVGTDFMLGIGKLKNTSRYKEAKSTIDKAKNKYNPMKTVVAEHSLGSSIANYIGSKDDQIMLHFFALVGEAEVVLLVVWRHICAFCLALMFKFLYIGIFFRLGTLIVGEFG